MPTLTIRNLPDATVQRLKAVAEFHGCSMEQEVRTLLQSRYAPRTEVLARVRGRWPTTPRITAAEVDGWVDEGRE